MRMYAYPITLFLIDRIGYNEAFLVSTKFGPLGYSYNSIGFPSCCENQIDDDFNNRYQTKCYFPHLFASYDGGVEKEDDDDDDYIDIDNLDTSTFNPSSLQNTASISSFGPGRGRSSPSQRKAMGKSINGDATVHVCTNCGAEFVNWIGRCSTCKQWNTVQEFRVGRKTVGGGNANTNNLGGNSIRPVFKSSYGDNNQLNSGQNRPTSWLTGVSDSFSQFYNEPVRITDVYKQMGYNSNNYNGNNKHDLMSFHEKRIQIPGDEELNNVLGGGIMPGSLILLGGDPGVGKSTLLLQIAGQVASLATPMKGIGMGKDDESISYHGPVLYVSGEENSVQIASR